MQKRIILILIITFLIGFLLRFYALGEIPNGMYQDETAIGYNAYSILQTGKDEYGEFLPVYFKSFGDYKLPVYIYSTVLSVAVFGLTNFAVRFPSALFGFLTLLVFFPFMKVVTKNTTYALLATILLAVTPWHLHYNRATFEISISLFLYITGSFLLSKGLRENKVYLFLLGTLLFGINIYTYNLTRILSPLLYIIILMLERKHAKRVSKSTLGATFFVGVLLLLPLIVTIFTAGGAQSASGTLIWSSAPVQAQLLEFRSYILYMPSLVQKLFFSLPLLTVWQFFVNAASYLSASFFFLTGSPHGNHGIGTVGQFYLFMLPFFFIGFFAALQRRLEGAVFFLITGAAVVTVASLTRESPHATRSFLLIPSFLYFISVGFWESYHFVLRIRNSIARNGVFVLGGFFIAFNILYYLVSYYVRFPVAYAPMWRSEDKKLAAFIKENERDYKKIIIDESTGFLYTSLLYYLRYPPQEFQRSVVRAPDDSEGFSKVRSFGKFVFKDVDWVKDMKQYDILIISTRKQLPGGVQVLAEFLYPKRPVVLSVGQDIVQFPVEDPAYVVFATNEKQ
ncbi:MAG: glycosyltransferase family 39 protein [Candidatus Levybacteria bacterium]|nr:glycosyltransferase family 39 protein [Candidatus Levybacteria bacterium]